MSDPSNAFTVANNTSLPGHENGQLSDLTFGAKDIFDIAGRVTGAGSPEWLSTHNAAEETAHAVKVLLDAGAELLGITACTELTRGIVGDNAHYGTPVNPNAPGRVPGGSSSGSASAVAGKAVDFALGSDTNGSITVPASFCGLFGMKPTRDRISRHGVFKQTDRFDTVGWLAGDANTLARVGAVMLGSETKALLPSRMIVADDAFALADSQVCDAFSEIMEYINDLIPQIVRASFCPVDLENLLKAHYVIHGRDAWQQLGDWLERINPRVSFNIARVFLAGSSFSSEDEADAEAYLAGVRATMLNTLSHDTLVCLPSAASFAWPMNSTMPELAGSITRTAKLVTIGTSIGAPQLTVPANTSRGLPAGLSFIGVPGSDESLLAFAQALEHLEDRTASQEG